VAITKGEIVMDTSTKAAEAAKPRSDLIFPKQVEEEYGILQQTQAVWRCENRYGWRDFTIKLGRKVAYLRRDIEAWIESRRGLHSGDAR
jgi:hypothetical protein